MRGLAAGNGAGRVGPAPLHVLLRPRQDGQVLGPGVQQGAPLGGQPLCRAGSYVCSMRWHRWEAS